ncbi:MAG: GNAT family N-acetyltransferase [Nanoarchaeota archaeon]|nr:GNAT family N-acetyltransferase [Nanoarchaeota archaeon]
MKIRKYKKTDKEQLRELCNDTAFNGLGTEYLFSDRQTMADIFIKYYTNFEPKNIYVAEKDKKIIGYLTGCTHPLKYKILSNLILIFLIPRVICRYFFKYNKKDKEFIRSILSVRFSKTPKNANHFHRNVKKSFRKKGIGTKLVKAFYKNLKNKRVFRQFIAFDKKKMKYYEEKGYRIYDYKALKIFPKKKAYCATAFIEDCTREKYHNANKPIM